ncbi:hypothetical protein BC937DRAFT_87348 [Endogone sp. FLAS-F59071]|nr:hypothetical protein BC937DRAFT_87348 [Endogone sp. FLAS-F59071]|eukprot:RUS23337.1 hypothetical protein BC937DRAFT_87348 [Endogone sp. FLAS-F59071]
MASRFQSLLLSFASPASRTCMRRNPSITLNPPRRLILPFHFPRPIPLRPFTTAPSSEPTNATLFAHGFRRRSHIDYLLEYMLWVVLGSEALHLIWLKINRREYSERTALKVEVLRDVVRRLEAGGDISVDEALKGDVKRLALGKEANEDDAYLEKRKCFGSSYDDSKFVFLSLKLDPSNLIPSLSSNLTVNSDSDSRSATSRHAESDLDTLAVAI